MLTIQKALTFGGLQHAVVLAGNTNLEQAVESISVLEVAESSISNWVVPGELYITSFFAIKNNIPMQHIVIRSLCESGGCGLVLCHVGTHLPGVDPSLIRLCDEIRFPLIQARPETSYVEIMNPIIEHLMAGKSAWTGSAAHGGDGAPSWDILAGAASPHDAFRGLASRMQGEVAFFDDDFECAYSNKAESVTLQEQKMLLEHGRNHKTHWVTPIAGKPTLAYPLTVRKRTLGYLIVSLGPEEDEQVTLEKTTALSGPSAALLNVLGMLRTEERQALHEFWSDLLVWNFPSRQTALNRAMQFDYSLDRMNLFFLVNVNAMQLVPAHKAGGIAQQIKKWFFPQLARMLEGISSTFMLELHSDTILMMLHDPEGRLSRRKTGEDLLKLFAAQDFTSVSIGSSTWFETADNIPHAFRQAFDAAIMGRTFFGDNRFFCYEDIYFLQQAEKLSQKPDIAHMAENFLRPLLEYDAAHGSDLLNTLRVIVREPTNINSAAQKLFIHRNTLLYRKKKISEMLDLDLDQGANLLSLSLALFSLRL